MYDKVRGSSCRNRWRNKKISNFVDPELEIDEEKIKSIVHKFSFKNQTARNNGEEKSNSFLRKGISGDWKNYFDSNCVEIFKHYSKDMLINLGYEEDNKWGLTD